MMKLYTIVLSFLMISPSYASNDKEYFIEPLPFDVASSDSPQPPRPNNGKKIARCLAVSCVSLAIFGLPAFFAAKTVIDNNNREPIIPSGTEKRFLQIIGCGPKNSQCYPVVSAGSVCLRRSNESVAYETAYVKDVCGPNYSPDGSYSWQKGYNDLPYCIDFPTAMEGIRQECNKTKVATPAEKLRAAIKEKKDARKATGFAHDGRYKLGRNK